MMQSMPGGKKERNLTTNLSTVENNWSPSVYMTGQGCIRPICINVTDGIQFAEEKNGSINDTGSAKVGKVNKYSKVSTEYLVDRYIPSLRLGAFRILGC